MFAAQVSGKAPMVVLIDLDGQEGTIEVQVEAAARAGDRVSDLPA